MNDLFDPNDEKSELPNDHSNEFSDEAEPSIAVNPSDIDEMVITAFTPTEGGNPNGPLFFSSDGGETWNLRFDMPGGQTGDQSPAFAAPGPRVVVGVTRTNIPLRLRLTTGTVATSTSATARLVKNAYSCTGGC